MQKKLFLTYSGQSLQKQDVDFLGEIASTTDDKVVAELFRLAPYAGAVTKAIIPHGSQTSGVSGLVAPGALGQIDVRPFRAIIGSRVTEATDPVANWSDVRSAVSTAEGATKRITSIVVAANATAFSRIDLVYAALSLESDGPIVPRKRKDPTTGVQSAVNVSIVKTTTVVPSIVQGTASATPALPALPSDGGGVYNIPIAYVRIAAGFSATTALIARADFHVIAPTVGLSPGTGAATLRPASTAFAADPVKLAAWANTASTRPISYVTSDLSGGESLLVVLDLTSGAESHATGSVIDASRDWRNRISEYKGVAGTGAIPWLSATPGLLNPALYLNASNNALFMGMGHSFSTAVEANRIVAYIPAAGLAEMTASSHVKIYADDATGALRVSYPVGGTHPNCKLIIRLTMTGPL